MPNSENNHYVKFYRGSANAWDLLLHSQTGPDDDTLYFVYDSNINKNEGKLYLGDRLIGTVGNTSEDSNLNIYIDENSLEDSQLLVYNDITEQWENKSIEELKDILITKIGQFVGATDLLDGTTGLVPMPIAGDQNSFLRGNSSWTKIDSNSFSFTNSNTLTLKGITSAAVGTIPIKTNDGLTWTHVQTGSLDTREIITLEALQEKVENEDPSINEHTVYLIENETNTYDEYRVIDGQIIKINNSVSINLNDYVTKTVYQTKINSLDSLLYDSIDNITGNLIPGLTTKVQIIEQNYVTRNEIGNLNELLFSDANNTTLVDEINSINERLRWQEINN